MDGILAILMAYTVVSSAGIIIFAAYGKLRDAEDQSANDLIKKAARQEGTDFLADEIADARRPGVSMDNRETAILPLLDEVRFPIRLSSARNDVRADLVRALVGWRKTMPRRDERQVPGETSGR